MDVVAWQIYRGDPVGATCHLVVAGPDAGNILVRHEMPLKKGETLINVRIRSMRLCADIMIESIIRFEEIIPQAQDDSLANRYYEIDQEKMAVVEERLRNVV